VLLNTPPEDDVGMVVAGVGIPRVDGSGWCQCREQARFNFRPCGFHEWIRWRTRLEYKCFFYDFVFSLVEPVAAKLDCDAVADFAHCHGCCLEQETASSYAASFHASCWRRLPIRGGRPHVDLRHLIFLFFFLVAILASRQILLLELVLLF